jgi:hypothetical protein
VAGPDGHRFLLELTGEAVGCLDRQLPNPGGWRDCQLDRVSSLIISLDDPDGFIAAVNGDGSGGD